MKPFAYIFDLESTLLTDSYKIYHQELKFIKRLGVNTNPHLIGKLHQMGSAAFWSMIKHTSGLYLSKEEYLRALDMFIFKFITNHSSISLKPHAIELLEKIKKEKAKIGIISSQSKLRTEYILDHFNLGSYIDDIATGDDIITFKPKTDIYTIILDKMLVHPDSCVSIEETKKGVLDTNKVGIRSIYISPNLSENYEQALFSVSHLGEIEPKNIQLYEVCHHQG
ncbi:MAG: HAD hydrolase-like protein [Hyphomicrobiales bacterium]